MKHLPLFAGINGFGLAADWMGWEQVAHCEIDEFCQKIIQYYWSKSIPHYDIKKTDFKQYKGTVDIISGGFPCQPYSVAGKQKGKEDERHLWPQMLRAIREIQPRWVVGENVRGLINWSGGLVFEEVQTDLESEGYEVWAFILPACGVDAPHRRDRVWFVAYRESESSRRELLKRQRQREFRGRNSKGVATHTNNERLQRRKEFRGFVESRQYRNKQFARFIPPTWENFPTQPPICTRNDGISSRLDGITFPKWRNESIKAAGNAIVPQVAFEIFKVIEEINATLL